MRMPPELLADVRDLGFDIVTLANNHMLDFGEVALARYARPLARA